jgi:TRAP-type C4-dicarboxylate transport system substrate-binding protein
LSKTKLGAENNPPSFVFDNHYQVAKFYTDSQHLIIPEMLVYSKLAWNKLSADDQALMKKFSREAQADARVLWDKKEADAFERMKAGGIEVDHIADKKPFRDAVKPVWDKYGAKYADMVKKIDAVT